jgi:hypothetical protein
LNLAKLAAIATIIAAVIGVWQFIERRSIESTVTSKLPGKEEIAARISSSLSKERAGVQLSLDLAVYKGERNWLLAMYEAAKSMPYASNKSDALKKVVKASLQMGDFNMAIIAAKESPYDSTKAEMLDDIVAAAVQSKENIGYAVVAADNMPYSSSKSVALDKIISAYEVFAKQTPQRGDKAVKPANKVNTADRQVTPASR